MPTTAVFTLSAPAANKCFKESVTVSRSSVAAGLGLARHVWYCCKHRWACMLHCQTVQVLASTDHPLTAVASTRPLKDARGSNQLQNSALLRMLQAPARARVCTARRLCPRGTPTWTACWEVACRSARCWLSWRTRHRRTPTRCCAALLPRALPAATRHVRTAAVALHALL